MIDVSGGLIRIGALLVAAALGALLLDETEIGRELSLRPWVSPGLFLGAALVALGVVLGTLGRVGRRVLPSRCARCGRCGAYISVDADMGRLYWTPTIRVQPCKRCLREARAFEDVVLSSRYFRYERIEE